METFSAPAEQLEIEISPEVQEIMDESREKRADILEGVAKRKMIEVAKTLAPIMPIIDIPALFAIAARGEKLTGEKIDAGDRLSYAATATILTFSYVLLATGQYKESLATKGLAAGFSYMKFGPEGYEAVLEVAKEHTPSIAPFIEKTGDLVKDSSELLENTWRTMMDTIAGNDDLIKLNLNG